MKTQKVLELTNLPSDEITAEIFKGTAAPERYDGIPARLEAAWQADTNFGSDHPMHTFKSRMAEAPKVVHSSGEIVAVSNAPAVNSVYVNIAGAYIENAIIAGKASVSNDFSRSCDLQSAGPYDATALVPAPFRREVENYTAAFSRSCGARRDTFIQLDKGLYDPANEYQVGAVSLIQAGVVEIPTEFNSHAMLPYYFAAVAQKKCSAMVNLSDRSNAVHILAPGEGRAYYSDDDQTQEGDVVCTEIETVFGFQNQQLVEISEPDAQKYLAQRLHNCKMDPAPALELGGFNFDKPWMVVKKYQFTSVNGESVARTFVDLRSYSDLEYKLFDEDSENAEVIEMWPGDEGGPELIVAKKSMLDANAELVTRAVEYLDDSNCLGTNPIITNCTDGQNRALIFNGAIATHMMVKQKIKAITSCDATPDQKTQMLKKLEANLTAKRLDVLEGKARTSGDIDVYVDSVRVFMESQVMCSTKGRRPAHAIAHQIVKSQISRAIDSLGLSCKVETVSQIRWNSTTLYNQLMLIYIGDKFNTPAGFHHVNIYLEKLLPDSCRAEIKLFMKELFSTADYNIAIGLIRTFADRMSEKMVAVTLPTAGAVEDSMAFSVPSDDEVTGAAAAARKPAVGGAGDASSGTSGREAVGRYTSAEASRAAAGGGGYSSGYSGGQSSLRQRAGRSSAAEGEVGNSHAAAHAPQEEMGCCERLMKNTKAFLGLGR